jgi:hypothetical protein
MDLPIRTTFALATLLAGAIASSAHAGTVTGKLELPPAPERPAPATRGFLDRTENPLAALRPVNPAPYLVIVLEGGTPPAAPPQVTWDLVGESFNKPVLAVPAGTEVVIRNQSQTARTLVAAEDPNLITKAQLNPPPGTKEFKVGPAGTVYTIGDPDVPHLKGRIIVVGTPFITTPDETGKFELPDVPEGNYKLRIYYKDGWLQRTDDSVTVPAKGKLEINPKLPAGYPVMAPAGAKK